MSTRSADKGDKSGWPVGKWIDDASIDDRAVVIARESLRLRLAHVERTLPLAANQYRNRPEHVHRLRVGCRRATAALSTFRPLGVGKEKRLKGWLRRLRRAAGPARDADVLIARFQKEDYPDSRLPEVVMERLYRLRKKAQQSILAIDSESDRFHRVIEKYLASLTQAAKIHDVLFGSYAREALSTVAGKFLALAEALSLQQHQEQKDHDHQCLRPTIDQLHQLRIVGKRLRYSIELFHSVFPEALRQEIYPKLRQLQDRLGALNDHDMAQSQFQQLLATMPPDDEAAELAHHIVRQREETLAVRREFLQWWTPEWARELHKSLKELLGMA